MSWDLKFISRDNLKKHVKETILQYNEALQGYNLKKFNSNIIDPIKLTFDKNIYSEDWEEIIKSEIYRQKDKTNSNIMGYFHQNLFNYINNCEVPNDGFDIIYDKKIYVEMKTKHNTMNSSSSQRTYLLMQNQILKDDKATCYLVEVISKKSGNYKWDTSLDGQKVSNERIRRVSIDEFLSEVTGDSDAFYKICVELPNLINEVVKELKIEGEFSEDTVFKELNDLDSDVGNALYALAFSGYLGFNK